jgi:hypothetical protein
LLCGFTCEAVPKSAMFVYIVFCISVCSFLWGDAMFAEYTGINWIS